MPLSNDCGELALALTDGSPSYTITRSAKYVAMMKSCSTTKAVFLACKIKRLMTLDAAKRCSESKKADGSSSKYTSAGFPKANTMATRCSSPPEIFWISWSMISSKCRGFSTSVLNCGCRMASRILVCSSALTVPWNLGEMVWGFTLIISSGMLIFSSSGLIIPASSRMNVVFPVPFSPSNTTISESVNSPGSTVNLNWPPMVLTIPGYLY
mmetsp:Transcript_83199/g.138807  ORF Transcript_83199/g.138807 Transcript_83199/m.138807 type:complete len:211 (+) Transcript_83199:194-826(+)